MAESTSKAWALGREIRNRRAALKMKGEDVAKQLGVTQPTITRWENGRRPEERYWPLIATFLELSQDDVMRLAFTEAPPEADRDELIAAMGTRWARLSKKQQDDLLRQIDETLDE